MSNIIAYVQLASDDGVSTEVMLVFANAIDGGLDDLQTWYDQVHIPELLAAFVEIESAQRFDLRLSSTQGAAVAGKTPDSLAVYRIRGSARELWTRIRAAGLSRSPHLDYPSVSVLFAGA